MDWMVQNQSDSRVKGSVVDGTDAVTIGDCDLDEAIYSPVSAPRVAHEPVLEAASFVQAIADDLYGVVSVDATRLGIEDAARVIAEHILVSLD